MKDKVIIITGASSGIGAELAIQLAGKGAKVVLAARDETALAAVAAKCSGSLVVRTDVALNADCEHLIEAAVGHFGRLDVLINNAGVSMYCRFEEVEDISIAEKIMAVNYFGSVYCTRAALPHLKRSKGQIVAVSSLAGIMGVPTRTFYAASKHAMQGFFDSLRMELLGTGMDVTVVSPGFVQSAIRERAFDSKGGIRGKSHINEARVMMVDECAHQIIKAIKARRRDLVMDRGRLAQWLQLLMPRRSDRMISHEYERGES